MHIFFSSEHVETSFLLNCIVVELSDQLLFNLSFSPWVNVRERVHLFVFFEFLWIFRLKVDDVVDTIAEVNEDADDDQFQGIF